MDNAEIVLALLAIGVALVTVVPVKGWAASRLVPSLMSMATLGVSALLLLSEARSNWLPFVALVMAGAAVGSLVTVITLLIRYVRQSRRTPTIEVRQAARSRNELR